MELAKLANAHASRASSVHGGQDAGDQFDDCESVHNAEVNG